MVGSWFPMSSFANGHSKLWRFHATLCTLSLVVDPKMDVFDVRVSLLERLGSQESSSLCALGAAPEIAFAL